MLDADVVHLSEQSVDGAILKKVVPALEVKLVDVLRKLIFQILGGKVGIDEQVDCFSHGVFLVVLE